MSDKQTLLLINNYLKQKWYIVAFFALFCASVMTWVKNAKNDFVVQSGNTMILRNIKIEDYQDHLDVFRYDKYAKSTIFLDDFIISTEKNINYSKLDANWQKKNKLEKYMWLSQKMNIFYYGAGQYEILFKLNEVDTKNLQYVKDAGYKVVDLYIDSIKNIDINKKIMVTNQKNIFPQSKPVGKKVVLLKYAFIGLILGGICSTLILSILAVRHNDA